MTLPDGLTCATCQRPFAGRLARRTDAGYVHAPSPDLLPCDDERHGTNAGYSAGCHCDDCKAAHAARKRARSAGEMKPLPFAPLAEWMPRVLALPPSSTVRLAAERAQVRGHMSVQQADRIAIAIGLHPGLIWVDHWWLRQEDEVA